MNEELIILTYDQMGKILIKLVEIEFNNPNSDNEIIKKFNLYIARELNKYKSKSESIYPISINAPMIPQIQQFQIPKNMYNDISKLIGINILDNENKTLPSFVTQIWRKLNNQSIERFHNEVKLHIQTLSEKGYNVEIEWLDTNEKLCQNEKDIETSAICRIVEKKQEVKTDWIIQQPVEPEKTKKQVLQIKFNEKI